MEGEGGERGKERREREGGREKEGEGRREGGEGGIRWYQTEGRLDGRCEGSNGPRAKRPSSITFRRKAARTHIKSKVREGKQPPDNNVVFPQRVTTPAVDKN